MMDDPGYDPFGGPMLADPYPFFALARERAPVFRSEAIGHWVVTRRADILAIFKDPAAFSAANTVQPVTGLSERARRILADGGWGLVPALGNNDRPGHDRFRRNVGRVFTARRVAALEPFVEERVHAALDGLVPRGGGDLVGAFLEELPARVILHLLGIPRTAPRSSARGRTTGCRSSGAARPRGSRRSWPPRWSGSGTTCGRSSPNGSPRRATT
ncbi:cytochrome P450 [Actinomadura sp. J1-007]|uniref:cytochrome P450 n=1 Tax=Actinomadura sp. J1-007 TaxID=2661913 RepID=UPI001F4F6B5C|nr:cytochrome P450 [Actinomadura sp. J1-007]